VFLKDEVGLEQYYLFKLDVGGMAGEGQSGKGKREKGTYLQFLNLIVILLGLTSCIDPENSKPARGE